MSKIRFNPDKEIVDTIKLAIDQNRGYCPCRLDKKPETKCMCQEFKDFVKANQIGFCHCGLYEAYDP